MSSEPTVIHEPQILKLAYDWEHRDFSAVVAAEAAGTEEMS